MSARHASSAYMEWAKTRSQARFNLASSGVAALPLSELEELADDLELTGPSFYGWPPLQERLARKAGVGMDHVVAATGTSMANLLALAVGAEAGEEVLIEEPTYELLTDASRWLGHRVRRFPRRHEDGFRLDLRSLEAATTKHTRLIVLTNLHNPSSAFIDDDTLEAVGELARSVGARVLVDEVYLEALTVHGRSWRSAVRLGPQFMATGSLTKAYGLGGLRCGWVLAEPDLARRMWRLHDLFGVIPAHAAERISAAALDHLGPLAARARSILEVNRDEANRFLGARSELECAPVELGMIVFPRLRESEVEALCDRLRTRYETTVVPGRFFGAPQHFRLALGCPTELLREGLRRLGKALDDRE